MTTTVALFSNKESFMSIISKFHYGFSPTKAGESKNLNLKTQKKKKKRESRRSLGQGSPRKKKSFFFPVTVSVL